MTGQLRILRAFGLVAALLAVTGAERAAAVVYKASIIHRMGYDDSEAKAISGTSILGQGSPSAGSGNGIAFLLDDSTHNLVRLDPDGWYAQPEDVSGDSQVGEGTGPTTGGNTHAFLWHGTADSLVDLNPPGFGYSTAYAVDGNNQVGVGYAVACCGPTHALLWHGTAASVVDLHPAGFLSSQANGVFADNIVGFGTTASGWRALLWQGAAHSVVNLHTATYPQTFASDASADSQVGTGIFSSLVGGERHALLWHGTAASLIDLQPTGFTQTDALGVAGALQVGFGEGTATGGQQHALLWAGSAASVVDLNSFLVGLGPTFVGSTALDIDDASGVIVGSAVALVDGNYVGYAVKWTPVPEPATMTLLLIGLVIAARRGVRRLPRRAFTLCAVLAIHDAARGQTTNWTGPVNGRWETISYWSAGVPTSSKDAVIANGGAASVIGAGCPIGELCYEEAKSVTVASGHSGGLNVIQFGTLFIHNNLSVGDLGGIGEVDLSGVGQIGATSGHIGGTFGAIGTVNLDNSSNWANSAELVVGDTGTGTLNVRSQSTVENDVGDVGLASGSHGTANVDGRDTTWTNNSVLAVGVYGTGVMHVSNGGSVSSSIGRIGREANSSGAVTVDGVGSNGDSNWEMTGDLTVGGAGAGSLGISNSGYVSNATGTIGTSASSTSTAVVTGSGSTWANAGDVVVGQAGNGTLEVRGGGKVSGVRGHVGFNTGSTGSVIVSDPGSSWTGSGSFFIGNGGSGSLQVFNGATASTAGNSYLGFSPGASGSAVVSGAGSSWSTAAQLIVGGSLAAAGGSGYLRVDDGGGVSATGGMTIRSTGSLVGNATINANVVNEGDVAPGDSPGTIHVMGNYTQQPGAVLEMQIAGTDPASFDHLVVDGSASISGRVVIQLIDGFLPQAGDQFDLMSVSGPFDETADVSFTGVSDAWQFSQAYDPATGMVVLTSLNDARPVPVPGDYNGDGIVDAADYTVWRDTLDQAGVGLAADGDGSGIVDAGDYDVWVANFGNFAGSAAGTSRSASAAVPEPATLLLLLIGLVIAARRGVRREPMTAGKNGWSTTILDVVRSLDPLDRAMRI